MRGELAMMLSGSCVCEAEGTASAKTLRQKCGHVLPSQVTKGKGPAGTEWGGGRR